MTTPMRFEEAFETVAALVRDRYGVTVGIGEVVPPAKGDLDGAEILIGRNNDPETKLFLVAHLFGHTVQWNTSAEQRQLGMTLPVNPDEAMLDRLEAYERQACAYSQTLFHEANVTDLDAWLADYSTCDFAFLRHLYSTQERCDFRRFWKHGTPRIEPLPIPPFTPRCHRRGRRPIVL